MSRRVVITLTSGETLTRRNGSWGKVARIAPVVGQPEQHDVDFVLPGDGSLVILQAGSEREAFAPGTWLTAEILDGEEAQ